MKSIGRRSGSRKVKAMFRSFRALFLLSALLAARGGAVAQSVPRAEAQPADSVIVEKRLGMARAQHLDTLPIGRIVIAVGRTFVGSPYVPHTLEVAGPERLVVDLREFDCVTFVENTLALARTIRARGDYGTYKRELMRIRYRNGKLAGYASRLHYFSEWISDNSRKKIVENVTARLGGMRDDEPITFMTAHASAYRQLAEPGVAARIGTIERRISREPRYVLAKEKINSVHADIHDGDIIAAATTVKGLDVEHTGIAVWLNGELHLMHAPLVGRAVEISPLPLAERIERIRSEDGIMVARPR
jgi:hypothetical protein